MKCVWCLEDYGFTIEEVPSGLTHDRSECSAVLVAKERERCAKIAETVNVHEAYFHGKYTLPEAIAKMIRGEKFQG